MAGALTACATQNGQQIAAEGFRDLGNSLVCCTTLGQAQAAALPLTKAEVLIDAKRQVFDFGGTKAYFVLYKLPAFTKPYSFVITSLPAGSTADMAILLPRVTLYDEQFTPTRYYDDTSLRNRGSTLERTVFINEPNKAERYVAIFGSDMKAAMERSYSMVTVNTIMVGTVPFNFYGGQDAKATIRAAPTGKLLFEVQGL